MAKRRRKRKVGAFQKCMKRKLKGKKVTRSAFSKAAKACAKGKGRKRRRRKRR